MKKSLLLFSLITFSASCNLHEKQPVSSVNSISLVLVVDVTDKKKLWPLPNPILKMFHCDKYPDAECRFNMQVISDKKINPSFSCYLPNATATEKENRFDDVQFRNKKILAFYAAVHNVFTDFYRQFDTTKSLDYSECWVTINNALQKLSEDKSDHKFLLIYSDLLEKSDAIDTYQIPEAMGYEAIAKKLETVGRVPDKLENITIIIVNDPPDREADKKFNTLLSAYKFLLEQKGAQVLIQATNTNNAL